MTTKSRVPAVPNTSRFALEHWFNKLYLNDLLFHPDDSPESIVCVATGEATFTPQECEILNAGLDVLFEHHGDAVYEVALRYTYKAIGFTPEHAEA